MQGPLDEIDSEKRQFSLSPLFLRGLFLMTSLLNVILITALNGEEGGFALFLGLLGAVTLLLALALLYLPSLALLELLLYLAVGRSSSFWERRVRYWISQWSLFKLLLLGNVLFSLGLLVDGLYLVTLSL